MKILQITSDYLPNPLWGMGWHVAQLQNSLSDNIHDFYLATGYKSHDFHKNIITTKKEDDLELLSSEKHEIFNDYNKFNVWQEKLAEEIEKTGIIFDIAHVHNWMSWITVEILKRKGIVKKTIITFHFLQKQYELMTENPIPTFHKDIINIEKRAMEGSDAIILLSDSQINLVKKFYGNYEEKVHLIPHSVNFNQIEFSEIQKAKIINEFIDIVFIGRIETDKGILETIEAFSKIKDQSKYKLHIVGDGPLLHELKEKHRENNIFFYGYLNRNEIKKILITSQIFCMPSTSENLPLSVLEAMFFGLVPIFTEGPSVPKLFNDMEHGVTIQLDNVNGKLLPNQKELNDKLLLLVSDSELRERLSESAYKLAIEKFSIQRMSENILNLYSELIEKI